MLDTLLNMLHSFPTAVHMLLNIFYPGNNSLIHTHTHTTFHIKCYKFQETDKSNIKILCKIRAPFLNSIYENTTLVLFN